MTTIRFGGYQPERSVHSRAVRVFGEALRRRPGADIDLQSIPNIAAHATGGKSHQVADLLPLTESGELDLCYFASSYLAGRVPELGLLDLPFEHSGRERVWAKLDGPVGDAIKAAVAARTGYAVLGFWDNGIRHISNGVRPIATPADCAGLSIRTLDNAFHQAIFASLGFLPRYIDVKDLGPEVTARTIDAQENPLTNIVNFAIHKTHRHVTLLGQFFGVALMLANRAALQRWPTAVRDAVLAAAAEATAAQRRFAAEEDTVCLRQIEAAGVAVVAAPEIDMPAFRAAVAPVVAREAATLDPALLRQWRA